MTVNSKVSSLFQESTSFLQRQLEQLENEYIARLKLHEKDDIILPEYDRFWAIKNSKNTSILAEGDKRLEKILYTLDQFGYERSADQINFNLKMVYAVLPQIYGDEDWPIHAQRVLTKLNIRKICNRIAFFCPRRFGKTTSVCLFCGTMLLNAPGSEIATFSIAGRTSGFLLERMIEMISNIEEMQRRVVKFTKEEIWLCRDPLPVGCNYNSIEAKKRRNLKTTSKFFALPSNPKTLRGTNARIVILEEANYINKKILDEIVAPLLLMKDAVIIAITSPSDDATQMAQQMFKRLPSTDEWLWDLVRVDKCELCARSDNHDMNDEECPHKLINLPKFRSSKNVEVVETMLDSITAQQEVHGNITGGTSDYFIRKYVDNFANKAPYKFERDVEVIHCFIDPSAGGKGSDFVICTLAYENGKCVIVGLDSFESRIGMNSDWNIPIAMMIQHVDKILQIYPNSHVFLYCEANLNFFNSYMYQEYIQQYTRADARHRIHCIGKNIEHQESLGIFTTHETKRKWAFDIKLVMSRQELFYSQKFYSQEPLKNKQKIKAQLYNYGHHTKMPEDRIFGLARETFNGKKTGDMRDDCAIAIQASISFCLESRNDDKPGGFIDHWCRSLHLTNF